MDGSVVVNQDAFRDLEVTYAPAALRAKASFSKTHGRRMMETFPLEDLPAEVPETTDASSRD